MADDILAQMLANAGASPAAEPSFHDKYIKPLGSAYPRQPWEWTKDYPGGAKFLGEGVPLALMGIRSAPGAAIGHDNVMAAQLERTMPTRNYDIGRMFRVEHQPVDPGVTGGDNLAHNSAPDLLMRHSPAMRDNLQSPKPLPTLRDEVGWEVASGNKGRAGSLADLNYVLDQLGTNRPARQPANVNEPRQPELANPNAGRMMQALDNGGKPPTVDLPSSPDLVAHYLAALRGGRTQPPGQPLARSELTVIPGGKTD